jgi:dienelactone hydrolase
MRQRETVRSALAVLLALVVCSSITPLDAQAQENVSSDLVTRELVFSNGEVQLAGTLYLPAGEGPFPAVVVMHGSGPDSRIPYITDAQMLAGGGVAALIFDKRGTGESTGDWQQASLDDLMADGLAAVASLQRQPEIDPAGVGVLGSSQGAWMAPFMSSRSDQVAFLVQITGAATPLANQEMWGVGNSLKARGFSDRAIEAAMKAFQLLYSSRGLIQRGILPLGDLWFVHYDPTLDPAAAWPDVRAPALVLYGGRDDTVPTETSLQIVKRLMEQSGHPDSRIVVFPDLGHALDGPSRNANPIYSTLVTGWITAVTRGTALPAMPFSDDAQSSDSLRWYGLGARTPPWYATAGLQLSLILLFILGFAVAVVASLLPWVQVGGRLPRLVLGAAGALGLFLTAGTLNLINYLLNADAELAMPTIPLSGWLLPLSWLSVLLAGALAFLWRVTRGDRSNRFGRLVFSNATLLAWLFIPFLGYWGLLGGRF